MQALLPQEDRKNESDGDKTTSAPSASQIASSRSQIICDLTAGEIRESVAVVSSVRQRVCNDQVAESRAALSVGGVPRHGRPGLRAGTIQRQKSPGRCTATVGPHGRAI